MFLVHATIDLYAFFFKPHFDKKKNISEKPHKKTN